MIGKTTIQVSRDTKALLDELGKKNDTYDDVIRKVLDYYIENQE